MVKGYEFPEIDELVVCTVQNVKNFGAFVSLDEYEGKEGFVHIAEVAPGWIKYIRDFIREGQKIVCKVLNVDESKRHVDLSLKQVNEHQKREKIQQWKNEQKAEKLFKFVAEKLGKTEEVCYEEFGFKLMDTYDSLYKAFEEAVIDEKSLEKQGFKGDWLKQLVQVAKENIVPPYVEIDGYLELTCPAPDGIDHIREALERIEKEGSVSVTVQYLGAPKYRVLIKAPNYKKAEDALEKASAKAITHVESKGGSGKFTRKD